MYGKSLVQLIKYYEKPQVFFRGVEIIGIWIESNHRGFEFERIEFK